MNLSNLQIHIVDHCNLTCDLCGHFSNITSPSYLEIDWFQEQITRVSKLFDSIRRLLILGGEPLLHPNLVEFLAVSRKHFPHTNIELWTNGILLERQKEDFWKALNRLDIELQMSCFPGINVDKTRILELARMFNVRLIMQDIKDFYILFNPKGDSNPKIAFAHCGSKDCTQLYNGKLYLCPRPAYIHNLNEKQGTQIMVKECNYVSIFSNDAKEKITEYLGKRMNAFSERGGFWLWRVGRLLDRQGLLGKRNAVEPLEFCRWCPEKRIPMEWTCGSKNC